MSTSAAGGSSPQGSDPAQTLLLFLADPYSSQLQETSLWIAFGTSIGALVVIMIFFSLIRPHNSLVYAPKIKYADRKHAPPPLGRGIFAWIKPVIDTKEDLIVEKVGLDAAIFLRFTKMLRNMFLALSVFGCAILIPVHVLSVDGSINTERTILNAMTPIQVRGIPIWSHVVAAYVFTAIVLYFLWSNYKAVARLRRAYFESPEYQQSLHSKSIWMVDIPSADRSDEGILRIADSVEQTASLPRAAIARNVKDLPELMEEHTETVKKLESVLSKYLKNPDQLPANRPMMRPSKNDHRVNQSGGKIDAIDYLSKRIKELEVEIKDVRESIDKRNPMSYGFAIYEKIEEAHSVAYAATKKKPAGGVSLRLAPKPNDFIWKNLSLSKKSRARKRFVANLWVGLLTVVWIAPNALIAIFLVNLSHLSAIWPAFATSFEGDQHFWSVVQAILGPALLSLVYILLPVIFRRLSTRAGDLTKTSRERHVTHKLYAFFVFNNLVVFSLFGAVWGFVASVINVHNSGANVWTAIQQANLPGTLLTSLCTVSIFWVTWLLQRNLGAAIDLAQLVQLTWVWFARKFLSPTPRQNIEWTAPPPFEYAPYYNYYLFYATVALANATLQPIVLPVVFFIFAIEAWLKKYLLLYIFITKTESGGQFWNILFNRVLFGLLITHIVEALVILGCEGDVAWTTYDQLICMVPLPFILLGFKIYCMRTLEEQCKFYIKALIRDPEHLAAATSGQKRRANERIGIKFGHPALYRPLIAPMVHAKAQHILPTLYHGRLGSVESDSAAMGYRDIALDTMSAQQTGKAANFDGAMGAASTGGVAGSGASMFEVVPESNLDFAYFKNRADFGDEHGGGGELFGRALDLVSERSRTPGSFGGADSDGGRSHAGTPPPMPGMMGIGGGIRQQRPDEFMQHPAFRTPRIASQSPGPPHSRDDSIGSARGHGAELYNMRNESGKNLLTGAAKPAGYAPLDGAADEDVGVGRGTYGLDRWRTGGSGYVGVSTQAEEAEGLGYEAYRPAGAGTGSHGMHGHGYQGSGPYGRGMM